MNRDSEAGTTLVELLVAISILAIISFALTESVIQALRTADGTANRYGESIDAQLLAASFGPDVQSAAQVETPFPSSVDPCSVASGTNVLRLSWTDGSVAKQSTYTLEATSGPQRHLVRRYCEADSRAADTSLHLVRQHTVASFVAADAAEPVVVTCDGTPCRTVRMSITDASGYTFTATGSRRSA